MTSIKTLLLGTASLALAATGAQAQVKIYIAGSNGDRVATTQAIQDLLVGETYAAGIAATANASNFSTFTGGTFNGTPVTVKTSFIGATGAIKAIAGNLPVRFLPDGATGFSNPNPSTSSNPAQYESAVPTFGVSTNFQTTSPYLGTYQGHTYKALNEQLTGIVALRFFASTGFPGNNLTTSQAQSLYLSGRLPLSFFTGNSAHHHQQVFAIGRDHNAGQRYGSLAEFGLGVNAVVNQWQSTTSDVSGTRHITGHVRWPIVVDPVSGESSQFTGNSGHTSGANLVAVFGAVSGSAGLPVVLDSAAYKVGDSAATAGYYIGYATPSDANSILPGQSPGGQAVALKWNGVDYSVANIQEGLYTAWLYTRVIRDPALTSGLGYNFSEAIASQVRNVTIASVGGGIKLDTVVVGREAEGGLVAPNENFF